MRYIFKFPDIGEGLDEGIIAEWHVEKGQEVVMGQPLVKMETDKVVTDIPSPRTGRIATLYGHVGETIQVGSPLAELDIVGVDGAGAIAEAARPAFEAVEEEGAGVVGTLEIAGNSAYLPATTEAQTKESKEQDKGPARRALATPVARALAKDLGVDIDRVPGTGPAGRVTKNDIESFVTRDVRSHGKSNPGLPDHESHITHHDLETEIQPLSQIRKAIARNMIQSKHNAAHMTVFDEVEVSELVAVRARFKETFIAQGAKLTYLPFILKATALALKQHPVLNAEMDADNGRLILKKYFNIGIAVDTDEGLVVPVVRNVDQLSIREIALVINAFSEKARKRELTLEDMKNGSFTITNYGSIGGQFAVPVINYPQAAILGIGRLVEKPVVKNGQVVPGIILPLSLSVDHRIVDGGETTRFLNRVMDFLRDPVTLIMG